MITRTINLLLLLWSFFFCSCFSFHLVIYFFFVRSNQLNVCVCDDNDDETLLDNTKFSILIKEVKKQQQRIEWEQFPQSMYV